MIYKILNYYRNAPVICSRPTVIETLILYYIIYRVHFEHTLEMVFGLYDGHFSYRRKGSKKKKNNKHMFKYKFYRPCLYNIPNIVSVQFIRYK